MPDLSFQVEGAEAVPYAAAPLLALKLRVANAPAAQPIQAVALQCQIRIEPARRRYGPRAQEALLDLFGTPDRWSETARSMLWTHVNIGVPSFTGSIVADLPVPCTFDFNVATAKYFYETIDGALQIAQIPWEKETAFRLPVAVWQEMMKLYYPNTAWLCLQQDVFDRLYRYKARLGLPTWEQALERLLPPDAAEARA